jgi:outer membrane protein TolC
VIHVQSRKRQLELASKAVEHALRSFKLNRARVFENLGLPIEVLQSLQSLALVRNIYVDAVVDYNESQYRLYVSLGQPPGSAIAKPARK